MKSTEYSINPTPNDTKLTTKPEQSPTVTPSSSGFVSSFGDADTGVPGDKSGSPERGFRHLLSVYADKCSLNGIIFIKSSKYAVVKFIWTVLLLGATGIMCYHLYRLASHYYEYEKQSKIDLKFENLRFPAVTICNVNAVKFSQSNKALPELQKLIASVNPSTLVNDLNFWTPIYQEDNYHYDKDGNLIPNNNPRGSLLLPVFGRKKRSTAPKNSVLNITVKHRTGSFFDDYNFTQYDKTKFNDFSDKRFKGTWEAESSPAMFDQIANQFTTLYSKENASLRQQMGHQIQDMLIQCSFSGRKCVQKDFTLVPTATFGNCYSIDYKKFITRDSGPKNGLSLMLYLETDDYIPGITNGKGAQLVIHEPGTLPFPDDEGLRLAAGQETMVGLRRMNIDRLGDPYGDCEDKAQFQEEYKIKYTRQACQEICRMEATYDQCGCFDSTKPLISVLVKSRGKSLVKTCQEDKKDVKCMEHVRWGFKSNTTTSCKCQSPCSEIQYRKTVSSNPWPEEGFAEILVKAVCKEDALRVFCFPGVLDTVGVRENFLKVTIFYEDLNYESLSEEPDYTLFQFISDVGGTVGLYIGLSVLSMFEILHLFLAISRYFFYGNWRKD